MYYSQCQKWSDGRMERRYGGLFVKTFNYCFGSTSPNIILHLTGIQQLPTDECGYVQHALKYDMMFPDNLELEKEYVTDSSIYDHNKLELERQQIKYKYKYDEWKSMSWEKIQTLTEKMSKGEFTQNFLMSLHGKQYVLVSNQTDNIAG
jgi:hypothetical protein